MPLDKDKISERLDFTNYDDIFASTTHNSNRIIPINGSNAAAVNSDINTDERIVQISLSELRPPEFHPFNVRDDEEMQSLMKSIKQYGVREPGIARPRPDGGYELLVGNRRKRASELAECLRMPIIIRIMDDYDAILTIVDSNLESRDKLLFSEKAWAYRVKMEALNHKGIKSDKISAEVIAEQTGDSRTQIFRFIRLTELIVPLLDKVDENKIKFNPAIELSYLKHTEQATIISAMEYSGATPSLAQAKRIRMLSQNGKFTEEAINAIMNEIKPKTSHNDKISNRFRKYFPIEYSVKQMNDIIEELLKARQAEQVVIGGTQELQEEESA